MSRYNDRVLGANYFWVLGLSDAPDPVADNKKLRRIIGEKVAAEQAKIAHPSSTDAEVGARTALLLALHERMIVDLGPEKANPPSPENSWIHFHIEYQAALKAGRAARQRNANTIFDILGDSELSRRLADKVADELDDASLFKEIISTRKITIRDERRATDVPPGFENACNTARRKASNLLPYLEAYGAEDVYQLLSITTHMSLSKSSSDEELAAAIYELQRTPDAMTNGKTRGKPLVEIKTELSDVFKVAQRSSKLESVRTILDDLLRLERAMPFFAMVKLMKSVDILRRDHVERIVVKGAAAGGLPPDRVLLLLKGLMKKDNITIGNWGLTGHFRVCAACGATSLGTDQICASCQSDLYFVCANCDARFDGAAAECPTCGTSKVDGEVGRAALAETARAIEKGDIAQAERAITKAMRHVPRSQVFSGLNTKLGALKSKAGSEEVRLSAMVRQKRHMVAAAEALGKMPSGLSGAVRERLQEAVDRALSEATAKTAEAQIKLDTGDPSGAERALRIALAVAADFTPALSLLDRIPPPPPKSLSVRTKGATAALSWKSPDIALDGISYVVVRSEIGSPRLPSDGDTVAITNDTACIDCSPTCGTALSYAVFTRRGATSSQEAARKDDVCILAPVGGLEARSDEHTIRLAWHLPKGARDAEVRRLPPHTPLAQVATAPVLAHAKTSYVDETASKGLEYRYHVTACYGSLRGEDLHGPAASILASITDPPSPISSLTLDVTHNKIHWRLPPRPGEDDEILLLNPSMRVPEQHSLVERGDLKAIALAAIGSQATIPLAKLPFGRHRLLAIRTRSGLTRIGPQLTVDRVTPPEDVKLELSETGAQVSWSWPVGCRLARLRVTIDRLTPQEFLVEADKAANTASKFIAVQPPSEISIRLTTLIEKNGPESDPITRQGQLVRKNVLFYEIVRRGGGFLGARSRETVLVVELKHSERLPEFEIRFHPEYVPGPNEGDCLRIVPAGCDITIRHEESIDAAVGSRQGFIGVIVTDSGIRDRMTIVPKNERLP